MASSRPLSTNIKDIKLRKGVGIGSAGLPSYNLLLEGHTQALENDVIIYMKQAQVPAVARWIDDGCPESDHELAEVPGARRGFGAGLGAFALAALALYALA